MNLGLGRCIVMCGLVLLALGGSTMSQYEGVWAGLFQILVGSFLVATNVRTRDDP